MITIASDNGPVVLFQNVGNFFSDVPSVTGDITYSVNGGPAQSLDTVASGFGGGAYATDTVYFFGTSGALLVGDTVVLSAGILTTIANEDGLVPTAGSFTTVLADGATNGQISTEGIAVVPEPKTWVMLLGGLGLLGCVQRFRRASRTQLLLP